jgi:hypothetical protein
MTIQQLASDLRQAETDIAAAVGPIIARLKIPHGVSIGQISIVIVERTTLGEQHKSFACARAEIDSDLQLNEIYP